MMPAPGEISSFVSPFLSGEFDVIPLQKDLSRRTYYGVVPKDGKRLVLCVHADPADQALNDFVAISSFLSAAGIGVPRVLSVDRERGWVLQTDAGSRDLTGEGDLKLRGAHYARLIETIVSMQKLTPEAPVVSRSFDEAKLKQEMDFFRSKQTEIVAMMGIPPLPFEFSMFLDSVSEKLAAIGGFVFVHRDLHSKNVMIGDDGSLTIIDFQDARMGLPWYDVASLLYDPYLDIGGVQREQLLRTYVSLSGQKPGRNLFYLQALQRTVKAMGTYLSVLTQERSPFYLAALKTAIGYLEEIVQLGGFPDHGFVYALEMRTAMEKVNW